MRKKRLRRWFKVLSSVLFLTFTSVLPLTSKAQDNGFILSTKGQKLFPIGFYELPNGDAELTTMANAGVNLVRCSNRSALERISQAGMMGAFYLNLAQGKTKYLKKQIESVVDHPALAVWEGPDEIVWSFTAASGLWREGKSAIFAHKGEWWKQTPEAVHYAEKKAKEIIPKLLKGIELVRDIDFSKRQIWINEARNSDVKFCRQYMDFIDITGCDYYPIRGKIRDAIKLGKTTERWSQTGRGKPVWMVLQAFSWSELGDPGSHYFAPEAYASFAESRLMAYISLVYGAKGILFWGSSKDKTPADYRQSLYALTSEFSALQLFLVSPDRNVAKVRLIEANTAGPVEGWLGEKEGWPPPIKLGVRSSVWKSGSDWLIILVNEDDSPHYAVEVTGLDDLNKRKLHLLYGKENVVVDKGEIITRMKPFEVKVFATSLEFESVQQTGRDYAGVFAKY
jgi:hypothetical protein